MEADIPFHRKMRKVFIQQALTEFHFPLSPEVVEDNVIPILEPADGISMLTYQNPRLKGFVIFSRLISLMNRLGHGAFTCLLCQISASGYFLSSSYHGLWASSWQSSVIVSYKQPLRRQFPELRRRQGRDWYIGKSIVERQRVEGWGRSLVEGLALDLQKTFAEMAGFPPLNVWRMRAFYPAWTEALQKVSLPLTEFEDNYQLIC
jgi:hypothetical protein